MFNSEATIAHVLHFLSNNNPYKLEAVELLTVYTKADDGELLLQVTVAFLDNYAITNDENKLIGVTADLDLKGLSTFADEDEAELNMILAILYNLDIVMCELSENIH